MTEDTHGNPALLHFTQRRPMTWVACGGGPARQLSGSSSAASFSKRGVSPRLTFMRRLSAGGVLPPSGLRTAASVAPCVPIGAVPIDSPAVEETSNRVPTGGVRLPSSSSRRSRHGRRLAAGRRTRHAERAAQRRRVRRSTNRPRDRARQHSRPAAWRWPGTASTVCGSCISPHCRPESARR